VILCVDVCGVVRVVCLCVCPVSLIPDAVLAPLAVLFVCVFVCGLWACYCRV